MFGNPSPLVTPSNYSKTTDFNKWYSQNPQEVELMMKQKFQQPMNQNNPYNQNYMADPYSELQNELSNCSLSVRNKILADKEYQICDNNCELLIRQAMEEVFIPQVLNTPKGRVEMERFVGVVKNLKEKYTQEEIHTNEQLQALLNDEVVRKRMQQLSEEAGGKVDKRPIQQKGDKQH